MMTSMHDIGSGRWSRSTILSEVSGLLTWGRVLFIWCVFGLIWSNIKSCTRNKPHRAVRANGSRSLAQVYERLYLLRRVLQAAVLLLVNVCCANRRNLALSIVCIWSIGQEATPSQAFGLLTARQHSHYAYRYLLSLVVNYTISGLEFVIFGKCNYRRSVPSSF